jgi:hypothetical protein
MAQGMKLLASPDVCKPASRMEQIRRFIIEIIALTFNANFDELNAALYGVCVPQGINSILSDDEHQYLLSLSDVVRTMHSQLKCGKVNFINREDEATPRESTIGLG